MKIDIILMSEKCWKMRTTFVTNDVQFSLAMNGNFRSFASSISKKKAPGSISGVYCYIFWQEFHALKFLNGK